MDDGTVGSKGTDFLKSCCLWCRFLRNSSVLEENFDRITGDGGGDCRRRRPLPLLMFSSRLDLSHQSTDGWGTGPWSSDGSKNGARGTVSSAG